jgi:hypothetical protein
MSATTKVIISPDASVWRYRPAPASLNPAQQGEAASSFARSLAGSIKMLTNDEATNDK